MRALITAGLVVGLVGLAGARPDDKKADPTGTWKWETEFNGQKRETVLKLKLEGDKLTGTISGGRGGKGGGGDAKPMETKIEDGKFKDGEVTFTVTREFNNMKFVTKYKAKIDGDTIKGESESERDGKTQKREFEGKRVKEEKKTDK
jgi:hypothetical protein